jgi:hypothetical protein
MSPAWLRRYLLAMGDNDVDLEALGFALSTIHDGDGLFVTPAKVA